MPHRLASLLDREQDRIALAWASALSRLRPSAFVYRPLEELRRLGRSYLAELIVYLDRDDPAQLREFIAREAQLRLNMGFGAAEVVQGFIVFRDLAQEFCTEIDSADGDRLILLRSLTDAIDFTIVEFVTQFQSLAEQRTNAHQQEVESLQRSLVDQAVHDDITDLFTPRFFEEHLTVEVKRAARYQRAFALIIVDIDHFEEYHARYGTLAASAALKITADALREFTRDLDVKARTDETEFGLAMPETSLEAAFMVAERIRLEIAAASPVDADVTGAELTVSIGLGAYPMHGETARELMQSVRRARDQARLLGGNMVMQAEAATG